MDFIDQATQYSAELVLGSQAFLSSTFTYTKFDASDATLKGLGATLAYDVPNDDASMCLGVSGGYGFGLESAGVSLTSRLVGPVLAVGVESEISSAASLVEYGQFGWYWEKVTADAGTLGKETVTSDYGLLLLGFSVVLGQIFAMGPAVAFPIGIESAPKIFTVRATIAFPATP